MIPGVVFEARASFFSVGPSLSMLLRMTRIASDAVVMGSAALCKGYASLCKGYASGAAAALREARSSSPEHAFVPRPARPDLSASTKARLVNRRLLRRGVRCFRPVGPQQPASERTRA